MPRIARIVGVGYPHHVVQRGNNRQAIFFDNEDRQLYLALLKKYSSECGCMIHAYCLMDNHVHILATPHYDFSLAKTMQKLSLTFTQHINKKYKRTGRLWECRFHSAVVDKDSYLWTVCRYIERNPVRQKIVNHPGQYKWSSANANDAAHSNFSKPIWQNEGERKEYSRFLTNPDNEKEIEAIKQSTLRGKPIGTEKFAKNIVNDLGAVVNTRPRGRPRK